MGDSCQFRVLNGPVPGHIGPFTISTPKSKLPDALASQQGVIWDLAVLTIYSISADRDSTVVDRRYMFSPFEYGGCHVLFKINILIN